VAPSTWLSVLLFLLFVAPGLTFDLLSQRRRAGLSDSAFREISRIVLASLFFSGAALGVLVALYFLGVGWLPAPARLLAADGGNYARANLDLVSYALLVEVGLALALATAFHVILQMRTSAYIRQTSAWTRVFRRDCPADHDVYVRVKLDDGSIYVGLLANFTADLEVSGRELVLAPPLYTKPKAGQLQLIPENFQRLVIKGDNAVVLSVDYRRKERS
jgi:hypothetical protein